MGGGGSNGDGERQEAKIQMVRDKIIHQWRRNNQHAPDLEPLLHELERQGWALLIFGRRTQPDAVAAVNRHQSWADVVVLRVNDRAAAYRTMIRLKDDPLQASSVVWHCLSDSQGTLRAVLDIPVNSIASVPYPIPEECRIREAQRRPLTIRLGRR